MGGVLIENPDQGLMKYCAKILGTQTDTLKPIFTQYETVFQRGEIHERDLWISICDKLEINLPTSTLNWKYVVKNAFIDKLETHQFLKKLKQNDYKTGFLSNTEIPAVEHFFEKKHDEFFDALIFSCLEKIAKPEEKIKVNPEEAVFIDDKAINIRMA